VLCSVGESQVAEVRQILEDVLNVKVLQLCNDKAENLVASRLQLLYNLCHSVLGFEVLEKRLDMRFNIGLLKAVSVLLSLYVFVGHLVTTEALLLPVELKVNVTSDCGHG
jgi:hypothetical protein